MKVKLKNNIYESGLFEGREYLVIEMVVINQINLGENQTFFLIENDDRQVMRYEAHLFNISTSNLNSKWIVNQTNEGNIRFTFEEFVESDFWENFYNDHKESIHKYNNIKKWLLFSEINDEECIEIITRGVLEEFNNPEKPYNLEKSYDLIEAFTQFKDERLIKVITDQAKVLLTSELVSRYIFLNVAFKYLSIFKDSDVNNFFIFYLENIEHGNDILTEIATKYFEQN
ncbi:hypothetical protein VQL36_14550 [Chengkuizengella sp. SCS-71B]|uniref:hypothetical protein n=1 Tax=Chengkuizengella sp. SCS-71B TaxID=3115290 RepID=UPI0032C23428